MIRDDHRYRIDWVDGRYTEVGGERSFTREELLEDIAMHPALYSPNVLLRPLYQSSLLPDVVTTGGPGELSYWMQLDHLFKDANITMPVRRLRPFVFYGLEKWHTRVAELVNDGLWFEGLDSWLRDQLNRNSGEELNLEKESEELLKVFDQLKERASLDPSLVPNVEAEWKKVEKYVKNLEQRLVRASKKKHEDLLSLDRKIFEKSFPDQDWQERVEGVLPYLMKYGKGFISEWMVVIPPTGNSIHWITT